MKKKRLWLFLALATSLVAGRYLLTNQHFPVHDDLQVFRLNEFITCFKDGQIPCRWTKNLGKGYGYPLFIFYPPMIYAIPALIHQLGFSLITSLNLFAFLTFPLAAFAMYRLINVLTNNPKLSFFGSALYTLYPYHASAVFVRGVYAENLAWSLLPLLFSELYLSIKKKPNLRPAIILSLILLTHNLSSILFYPLSLIWATLLLQQKKSSKLFSKLKITALNFLLPFGITAFFLIPALAENQLVQTESLTVNYYSYKLHFVSFKQLFWANDWGYGSSNYGLEDGMSFMIGKPYWILFVFLAAYFVFKNRKNLKKLFRPIPLISLLGAPLFLFLTHIRSTPIWKTIKPLQYLQFPWRLLGLVGFFFILFIAYSADKFPKKVQTTIVVLTSTFLLIRFLPFFQPEKYDNYTDQTYLNGKLTKSQQDAHLYDYLPKTVHEVPAKLATKPIHASQKPLKLHSYSWQSDELNIKLTSEEPNQATFSIYDYPGWQAYLNSQKLNHKTAYPSGLIKLDIPQGEHEIQIKFQETTPRKLANLTSLFSLLVFLGSFRFLKPENTIK